MIDGFHQNHDCEVHYLRELEFIGNSSTLADQVMLELPYRAEQLSKIQIVASFQHINSLVHEGHYKASILGTISDMAASFVGFKYGAYRERPAVYFNEGTNTVAIVDVPSLAKCTIDVDVIKHNVECYGSTCNFNLLNGNNGLLRMFQCSHTGGGSYAMIGNLYSVKCWDAYDNKLCFNGVPVAYLNDNAEEDGGIWDKAGKRLLKNLGIGKFQLGEES